jgi:hypothetical protein
VKWSPLSPLNGWMDGQLELFLEDKNPATASVEKASTEIHGMSGAYHVINPPNDFRIWWDKSPASSSWNWPVGIWGGCFFLALLIGDVDMAERSGKLGDMDRHTARRSLS